MKRKSYCGGTHEEALDRLCFVCGEIVKDNRSYTVEKNLDLLGKALNCPEIFTIPDVTPTYICKKCHLTLSKVNRGETVITGRKLMDWVECGPSCRTCELLLKRKEKGSRKKVSMPLFIFKVVFSRGRHSAEDFCPIHPIWNQNQKLCIYFDLI